MLFLFSMVLYFPCPKEILIPKLFHVTISVDLDILQKIVAAFVMELEFSPSSNDQQ